MKLLLLVMGLLGSFALAAVGCGGGGGGGGGTTGGGGGGLAANQVLNIAWGAEPPSLDPGLATDTTSSNVLLAIMDPLVKLNPDTLQAEPSLAESWDVSADGKTVTFHLSHDGKWTNGDPVTASDFVYSWKRTLSPELAADYAYQLYGIVGAQDYNSCEKNCDALADKVGVEAPDDFTLVVHLTSAQPWFIQQASHHSFLAVHRATVEKFGDKWTEPQNIVTDGPFMLKKWEHDAEIDLVKNPNWRDAKDVKLTAINGKIIVDGTTRVQAFESGEVDTLDGSGLPPDEIARLKTTPEYELYPSLGTYYYGFNMKNISDIHERRALSLAINRRQIIDQIAQADQLPATGFTPKGISGFDQINPNSPWLPENGDLDQAKSELSQAASPKKDINLFFNDAPGHKEIATAVQAQWQQLGIKSTLKQQEWAQYLEFLGPPPNNAVDVYRLGWIYDFPDAINGLELWTCDSGNNNTNYCDKNFDALVAKAKATTDDSARYDVYGQLEQMLFGQDGALPLSPIYWYTYPNLEKQSVKDSFFISPLDQIDFTKVVVKAS
ncbi:MAG TPA: peptide ABC transporter substrate-binding protein [Gaiellaceae bacterium]|jgi:ABC-type oligopeptide transport system substrate-binding subunit|nr:peptide ABC transporter substrate-binding protein [Gaiellaceae bacterium]